MALKATFYITTGQIDSDRLFWWDEVEALVLKRDEIELNSNMFLLRNSEEKRQSLHDIMDIFRAITSKRIKNLKIKWNRGSAVCVVLTAKGYPGKYDKNIQIYGLNNFSSDKNYIFHAGTTKKEDKILTSGGRVLGITARGDNLKKAIKNVYGMIGNKRIHFSGMHFRKDIGKKGMDKKLWK